MSNWLTGKLRFDEGVMSDLPLPDDKFNEIFNGFCADRVVVLQCHHPLTEHQKALLVGWGYEVVE